MDRLKVSELRSLGMAPSKVGKDFHTWLKVGSRVRSTEAVAEGWLHSSARNHRKGFLVESKVGGQKRSCANCAHGTPWGCA